MSALRLFWASIYPAFLRILLFPILGLPLGVEFEESPLGDQRIRQTEWGVKLCCVLAHSKSEKLACIVKRLRTFNSLILANMISLRSLGLRINQRDLSSK